MIRDFTTREMIFTYGDAIEAISPLSKGNEYYYECKKVDGIPQYETYENIVWLDTNADSKPSEADVKAKFAELVAEYEAQVYARNRDAEYPAIKDQLDYIYHNGVDKWKTDMIDPVKDKYPKG